MTDYEAKYPQVLELSEDDVVLMHETLSRYEKYRNQGHQVALEELVKFLKREIGYPIKYLIQSN